MGLRQKRQKEVFVASWDNWACFDYGMLSYVLRIVVGLAQLVEQLGYNTNGTQGSIHLGDIFQILNILYCHTYNESI